MGTPLWYGCGVTSDAPKTHPSWMPPSTESSRTGVTSAPSHARREVAANQAIRTRRKHRVEGSRTGA